MFAAKSLIVVGLLFAAGSVRAEECKPPHCEEQSDAEADFNHDQTAAVKTVGKTMKQPSNDIDTLRHSAKIAKAKLMEVLAAALTKSHCSKVKVGPIKGMDRIKEKIATDKSSPALVWDYARATLVCPTYCKALAAKALLKDDLGKGLGFTEVRTKDLFLAPAPTGYRAFMLNGKPGNLSMIVEVQVQVASLDVLYKDAHKYYEIVRSPHSSAEEKKTAEAHVKKMYDDAWHKVAVAEKLHTDNAGVHCGK